MKFHNLYDIITRSSRFSRAQQIGKAFAWKAHGEPCYARVWTACEKFPLGGAQEWEWIRKTFFRGAKSGSALWLKNWLDKMIVRMKKNETTDEDKIMVKEYFEPYMRAAYGSDFTNVFGGR